MNYSRSTILTVLILLFCVQPEASSDKNIPSNIELDSLTKLPPNKDEYETSAAFAKRLADYESRDRQSVSVVVPVSFQYDADNEVYLIPTCFEQEFSRAVYFSDQKTGVNAMGAEWSWKEELGRINRVRVEDCKFDGAPEELRVPLSLKKAIEIRDVISVVAQIEVPEQTPSLGGPIYNQIPEFGKSYVDKTKTLIFLGYLKKLTISRTDSGQTITAFDFSREIETRDAKREKFKKLENTWSKSSFKPVIVVNPVYPRRAKSRGLTGSCLVTFTVTETGTVENPFVAAGDVCLSIFEKASKKAALKLKYIPHTDNGYPTKVENVKYLFNYGL